MNIKSPHSNMINRGILALILVVVIGIPRCVSQNEYEVCRQPFTCGSLTNLSYPFYGANRQAFCGYPGFSLTCQDGVIPLINTSSIFYRVLNFDNQTQTIRVARNDLWSSLCTRLLINTTLDTALYNFYSTANDQEITLYYGCTGQTLPVPLLTQFNCNGPSFFAMGEINLPGTGITCGGPEITVRINQSAAAALPTAQTTVFLQTSLQQGFSVEWLAENQKCEDCVRSGGVCGSNSGSFACYCANGRSYSTCGTNGSEMANFKKYAIIGVSFSVPILVLLVYCLVRFLWKESNPIYCLVRFLVKESNPNDVEKFLHTHGSLAQKRYNYYQIKKMTKSFKDKLGQGGFGIVYKGELPDGQPVAVKVLTQTRDDDEDAEEFINEVASISRTSHVNIVNLLGFCFERKKRALVYEFMPNKSLDNYINKADCSLEWNKLYEVAVGVARGLEYLHRGCNTRIVHFDIKPQNILLDEDFRPKISDFGLAKLFKKKQSVISMLGMRGTIGYIAPEVFSRNFGAVSHKSDVYSYGMMLLQMAEARKIAVDIEPMQSSENYFSDNIYELVLLKNEKMNDLHVIDDKEESEIKMLMVGVWCIQTAPSDRPSISKVLEMLEGSLQSIQIPPKPFFPPMSGPEQFISSSMNMDTQNST